MKAYTYILRCSDHSYDTGVTSDLELRFLQHQQRFFPNCYTAKRLPVTLVFSQEFSDIQQAIAAERQIKGWSRKKKEALIQGEFQDLIRLSQNRSKLNSTKNQ